MGVCVCGGVSNRVLWGPLTWSHVRGGVTTWFSMRFLFVVNMNLHPHCIAGVTKIVTAETV